MVNLRKIFLFSGILFLVSAIVLRACGIGGWGFYLPLAVGVLCKIMFVALSFRVGKMKIGLPMYILLLGLTLFLTGLMLKRQMLFLPWAEYLLYVGIGGKALSVVLFIKNR